jgi:cytochrome oxidase Cu insertion factor (SCO1/SenC/PrrC family)
MRASLPVFVVALSLVSWAPCQERSDEKEEVVVVEKPRDRVVQLFNETSPDVGQPLPDLVCFDDEGNPFPLNELKGKYTVLLFGCLT